jgi:Bifunctional DNA primase/polymerase, N-terminal
VKTLAPPAPDRQHFLSDANLTVAAVRVRGWEVVKLFRRSKRPWALQKGDPWTVTTDPDEVAAWLAAGFNIGNVSHERTGFAVLDPDDLNGWADMVDTLGQPSLPWVSTGRGRLHYYVAWTPDLPAHLLWRGGADLGEILRGPGQQQVVLPPSVHPVTGKRYSWLVDPITEPLPILPGDWLAYLLADDNLFADDESAS